MNASIANIFSASLYRVGHTMLPNELLLLNEDGSPVEDFAALGATVRKGQSDLGEAFFNPALITAIGIEPYLKGSGRAANSGSGQLHRRWCAELAIRSASGRRPGGNESSAWS